MSVQSWTGGPDEMTSSAIDPQDETEWLERNQDGMIA